MPNYNFTMNSNNNNSIISINSNYSNMILLPSWCYIICLI